MPITKERHGWLNKWEMWAMAWDEIHRLRTAHWKLMISFLEAVFENYIYELVSSMQIIWKSEDYDCFLDLIKISILHVGE